MPLPFLHRSILLIFFLLFSTVSNAVTIQELCRKITEELAPKLHPTKSVSDPKEVEKKTRRFFGLLSFPVTAFGHAIGKARGRLKLVSAQNVGNALPKIPRTEVEAAAREIELLGGSFYAHQGAGNGGAFWVTRLGRPIIMIGVHGDAGTLTHEMQHFRDWLSARNTKIHAGIRPAKAGRDAFLELVTSAEKRRLEANAVAAEIQGGHLNFYDIEDVLDPILYPLGQEFTELEGARYISRANILISRRDRAEFLQAVAVRQCEIVDEMLDLSAAAKALFERREEETNQAFQEKERIWERLLKRDPNRAELLNDELAELQTTVWGLKMTNRKLRFSNTELVLNSIRIQKELRKRLEQLLKERETAINPE